MHLTADEVHNFYHGFCNEVIWPLFHDLPSVCNFEPAYWRSYREVNRKFAQSIMVAGTPEDFLWVHDYHLMNVAMELRNLGCTSRIGCFLHIPFPPPDLFVKLPWCTRLIEALLKFDLVGFQTLRDRDNFVHCVRTLVEHVQIRGKGETLTAMIGRREVRVGAFPIGVDFNAFLRQAATPQVATTNSRYASVSRHAYARRRRTSAAMRALVKPPQMQICLMAWWMVSSLHRLLQVAGGSLIAGPGLCIQDLEVGEYSRLSSPQQRLRWF